MRGCGSPFPVDLGALGVFRKSDEAAIPESPGPSLGAPAGGGPTDVRNERPVILVDASNVAHGSTSSASPAKIENLKRVLDRFGEYPVRVLPLADASLRHKIDHPRELESMMNDGTVEQLEAKLSGVLEK
ncbi:MAG: hypothetical protein L3K07_09440, partial [Thermoplasmata archaeon]|nr:hypothetical protein [Thermoplasmata archaeon]